MKTASKPSFSSASRLLISWPKRASTPKCEDALDLLVEHRHGQAEGGDVGAHQPAALGVLLEQHAAVAERQQIARHRERGRAGADQRDALAVLLGGDLRHEGVDLALVVGGDALEAADGDRLLLDAAAPAGGLARAIADAAQDAGEDVALPVQHVGRRIAPLGDQPDVLGNGGMARTCPLAVDDLVEVVRIGNIGRGRAAPASCRDVARLHHSVPVRSLPTRHPTRLGCVIPTSTLVPGLFFQPANAALPVWRKPPGRPGLRPGEVIVRRENHPWERSSAKLGLEGDLSARPKAAWARLVPRAPLGDSQRWDDDCGAERRRPSNVIPAPLASEARERDQKLWGAGGEGWHLRRVCVNR